MTMHNHDVATRKFTATCAAIVHIVLTCTVHGSGSSAGAGHYVYQGPVVAIADVLVCEAALIEDWP